MGPYGIGLVIIGVEKLVPQRDRQGSTLVVLDVSSALEKKWSSLIPLRHDPLVI